MAAARALAAILAALLGASAVGAHELEDNRATLVLRDGAHLSLTVYVRYTDVVRRVLAPGATADQFLVACAAMKPDDLQTGLRRVQAKLQPGTRVTLNGGREVPMTNWTWPDAARVQTSCQRQVMAATVGQAAHTHEEPVEIRADLTHDRPIDAATVRLPDEFGRVLLVWYRAHQTWLDPRQPSPPLRFR